MTSRSNTVSWRREIVYEPCLFGVISTSNKVLGSGLTHKQDVQGYRVSQVEVVMVMRYKLDERTEEIKHSIYSRSYPRI